jgi:ribosomal protein S18 acetylase RimI-like enzyme
MVPSDVGKVVEIHLAAFQGFFLSFLGRAFLVQLYEGILHDPSGMAFVVDDGRPIAFVAGSAQPSGLYRRLLLRRWFRFALAALPALLRSPRSASRLMRALRAPADATATPGTGTLMSIAVLPQAQGAGVGRLLVDAFLHEGRRRGLSVVDLTTDAIDNDGANNFYANLGFRIARTYTTPEGRVMNEYRIQI